MDDTKREELEKACKKEKNHKVRTRMVAVRMVRVRNMPVEETADILVRCPTWVRNRLRRYDEGGLEGLRDLPRCGRPRRILRNVMDEIIANVAGCRITPMGLQQYILELEVLPQTANFVPRKGGICRNHAGRGVFRT